MIVVTGISGVGKTTILKKTKHKNIVFLDDVVKNKFYKRKHPLYLEIKKTFGSSYVNWRKVDTNKLGKLVFSDNEELLKLDRIVKPYIVEYLNKLKESNKRYVVEMATYIKNEKEYRNLFDQVILIDRNPILKDKFNYLENKTNPLKINNIDIDLVINDENLDDAVVKLNSFLN